MKSFWIILLVFVFACGEDKECCFLIEDGESLKGEWVIYERGYSPGAGYIVEEIPNDPRMYMNFGDDNRFSSNYTGLEDFEFYYVLFDEENEHFVLVLFEDRQNRRIDLSDLTNHSYIIESEGNQLRLGYRYCIEGCHLGLRK